MKPFCYMSVTYEVALFDGDPPADFADMFPVFTEAQLNQARADVLREAAEKFSHNLLGQQNLDARNGVVLAINELRRTSDEIDGGKK